MDLRIFSVLFLAVAVTATGAGIVAPLLPVYAHDLGANALEIGLIFSAFSLTRSLFVPYFGRLSDSRGHKPFILWGLCLYCLVSLLYFIFRDVFSLIGLRLAQGFASAMILPVAQAYVGELTPHHKEGQVMGIFNLSIYLGLSAGPVLGGVIKEAFGIEAAFVSMGGLSLAGFLLCLCLLPAEGGRPREAVKERSGVTRYRHLIARPAVLALFAFRTGFTICIGMVWTFLPLLASTHLGLSSAQVGIVVTSNVLLAGLLQVPAGSLADRVSKKRLIALGGLLAAGSIAAMQAAQSFGGLLAANGCLGLAGGISMPAVMALGVIEGRRTQSLGMLMGILALAHSLGMLIGPVLAGLCIDLFSLGPVFTLGATVAAAGTLLFCWKAPGRV